MTAEKIKILGVGLAIVFGTSCCKAALDDPAVDDAQGSEESSVFSGAGRVVELLRDSVHVKVKHGRIEGLMEAMDMSFPLKNTDDLRLLKAGDSILFEIVVEPDGRIYLKNIISVEESHE